MIDLHILNKSGRLDPLLVTINKSFSEGVNKIQQVLPVDGVDIVIFDSPEKTIPETGVGGEAPTAHIVNIYIDPLSEYLSNLDYEIKSTLAHELHHCARMKEIGYGKTLWEAMISEGLTAHFDIEINAGEPRPWDVALATSQISELLKKAETDFSNESYNHSDWFFGREDRGIPRWTGYSLGFHIVGEYLKDRPETTAAKLYKTPASEFKDVKRLNP